MTDPVASSPAAKPDASTRAYVFRGEGHGLYQRLSWDFGRLVSRVLATLLFRFHASGQNNIPTAGGVLMITNHQSFLDPWLIGIAPPRQIHYMARDTLFKRGFLGYLLELWNAFPVRRGSADLTAIRTAVERLEKGFVLNIFPEGTRSEDGSIGAIAPGFTLILNRCKSDVAILPVIIDGAFETWPRKSKFPKPFGKTAIRIHHGTPIPATEWRALDADALARRVRGDMVKLQGVIGSPHAAASERRLVDEAAAVVREPTKPRRRRGPASLSENPAAS